MKTLLVLAFILAWPIQSHAGGYWQCSETYRSGFYYYIVQEECYYYPDRERHYRRTYDDYEERDLWIGLGMLAAVTALVFAASQADNAEFAWNGIDMQFANANLQIGYDARIRLKF